MSSPSDPRSAGAAPDRLRPKAPRESRTELAEIMFPHHANVMGKVFGGTILELCDKAGGTAAIRHSGRICVTARIDEVSFHAPVEIGEMLQLVATVTAVGRTSLEVAVRVTAMNVRAGTTRHTNDCFLTMVAIDDAGKPTPVCPLAPETDEERRLEAAARARMAARKKARGA